MSTLDSAQVQTVGYPVRLDGRPDADLSRWMWLVKWFLAIPHLVVLALLWAAFPVVMVIAGVAVLVTDRYPRPLFEFTVAGRHPSRMGGRPAEAGSRRVHPGDTVKGDV